jgi:hypothetical protein
MNVLYEYKISWKSVDVMEGQLQQLTELDL